MWRPLFYSTFSHLWSIHLPARVTCPALSSEMSAWCWHLCLSWGVRVCIGKVHTTDWLKQGLQSFRWLLGEGRKPAICWASCTEVTEHRDSSSLPLPTTCGEQIILFHVQRLDWPMPLCRDRSCNLWPRYNYVIENTCWLTGCPRKGQTRPPPPLLGFVWISPKPWPLIDSWAFWKSQSCFRHLKLWVWNFRSSCLTHFWTIN